MFSQMQCRAVCQSFGKTAESEVLYDLEKMAKHYFKTVILCAFFMHAEFGLLLKYPVSTLWIPLVVFFPQQDGSIFFSSLFQGTCFPAEYIF